MTVAAVFADLGERPAWRVSGDRALPFLHDVLTQSVSSLPPGSGALGALLTDKGRVRAVVRVLATGDGATIDAEPASVEAVEAGIVRLAPLGGAEAAPDPRRLLRLTGPVPDGIGGAVGPAEHDHAEADGALLVRTVWGGAGLDVLARADAADRWIERLSQDARFVPPQDLEALRIRDGRPVYGVDVTEEMLVNETPLVDRAVSFSKGCYPGQESVARVRNLGRVRRRLVAIRVDGPPPEAGAEVRAGEAVAGRVTSAAPDGDGAVALVFLDAGADAGALVVAGLPASIIG